MELQESEIALGCLVHPTSADDGAESGEEGAYPGIVVVHDVWGLSDHTRDIARRLAACGFNVLAIDLYRREDEVRIDDPGQWMQELSDPDIGRDIEEAARLLRGHPISRNRKVAVVGFCMGGMYALLSGCRGDDGSAVSAAVAFYGLLSHRHGLLARPGGLDPASKPVEPIEAARHLHCPLLALFGDDDAYVSQADVAVLRERLVESGRPFDVISYSGVGHAFMNDTRPDAHDPEVAADAWDRMLAFLQETLASVPVG